MTLHTPKALHLSQYSVRVAQLVPVGGDAVLLSGEPIEAALADYLMVSTATMQAAVDNAAKNNTTDEESKNETQKPTSQEDANAAANLWEGFSARVVDNERKRREIADIEEYDFGDKFFTLESGRKSRGSASYACGGGCDHGCCCTNDCDESCGNDGCYGCDAGYGGGSCRPCDRYSYKGYHGYNACTRLRACPIGQFRYDSSSTAATSCFPCPNDGYVCNGRNVIVGYDRWSYPCRNPSCPPGTERAGYCNQYADTHTCTKCVRGKYQPNTVHHASYSSPPEPCTDCLRGSFSSNMGSGGSASCTFPQRGHHVPEQAMWQEDVCGTGTYSTTERTSSVHVCTVAVAANGEYSDDDLDTKGTQQTTAGNDYGPGFWGQWINNWGFPSYGRGDKPRQCKPGFGHDTFTNNNNCLIMDGWDTYAKINHAPQLPRIITSFLKLPLSSGSLLAASTRFPVGLVYGVENQGNFNHMHRYLPGDKHKTGSDSTHSHGDPGLKNLNGDPCTHLTKSGAQAVAYCPQAISPTLYIPTPHTKTHTSDSVTHAPLDFGTFELEFKFKYDPEQYRHDYATLFGPTSPLSTSIWEVESDCTGAPTSKAANKEDRAGQHRCGIEWTSGPKIGITKVDVGFTQHYDWRKAAGHTPTESDKNDHGGYSYNNVYGLRDSINLDGSAVKVVKHSCSFTNQAGGIYFKPSSANPWMLGDLYTAKCTFGVTGQLRTANSCPKFAVVIDVENGGNYAMKAMQSIHGGHTIYRKYYSGNTVRKVAPIVLDGVPPTTKIAEMGLRVLGSLKQASPTTQAQALVLASAGAGAGTVNCHSKFSTSATEAGRASVWGAQVLPLKDAVHQCGAAHDVRGSGTQNPKIVVAVQGWTDNGCSMVHKYTFKVCRMTSVGGIQQRNEQACKSKAFYGSILGDKNHRHHHVPAYPVHSHTASQADYLKSEYEMLGHSVLAADGSHTFTYELELDNGKPDLGKNTNGYMWDIDLQVEDEAHNYRHMRRVVLHQSRPQVTLGTSHIKVLSAACKDVQYDYEGNTHITHVGVQKYQTWKSGCETHSYPHTILKELWQWNTTYLAVNWDSVFKDSANAENGNLQPFRHTGTTNTQPEYFARVHTATHYDDPMVRSIMSATGAMTPVNVRAGIPNNHGIVKFEWDLRDITNPGSVSHFWNANLGCSDGTSSTESKCKTNGAQWLKGWATVTPKKCNPVSKPTKFPGCDDASRSNKACTYANGQWTPGPFCNDGSPTKATCQTQGKWSATTKSCNDGFLSSSACVGGAWSTKQGKGIICNDASATETECAKQGGLWNDGRGCNNGSPNKEACITKGNWVDGVCSNGVSQSSCAGAGGTWTPGTCAEAPDATKGLCKAAGNTWTEPVCRGTASPTEATCVSTGLWTAGMCDNGRITSTRCSAAGGTWVAGKGCSKASPSEASCTTVGTWSEGCDVQNSPTPALCKMNKGSWTEGTCDNASPTQSSCADAGSFTWTEKTGCNDASAAQPACENPGVWVGDAYCTDMSPTKFACENTGNWANFRYTDHSPNKQACTTVGTWANGACDNGSNKADCAEKGGLWTEKIAECGTADEPKLCTSGYCDDGSKTQSACTRASTWTDGLYIGCNDGSSSPKYSSAAMCNDGSPTKRSCTMAGVWDETSSGDFCNDASVTKSDCELTHGLWTEGVCTGKTNGVDVLYSTLKSASACGASRVWTAGFCDDASSSKSQCLAKVGTWQNDIGCNNGSPTEAACESASTWADGVCENGSPQNQCAGAGHTWKPAPGCDDGLSTTKEACLNVGKWTPLTVVRCHDARDPVVGGEQHNHLQVIAETNDGGYESENTCADAKGAGACSGGKWTTFGTDRWDASVRRELGYPPAFTRIVANAVPAHLSSKAPFDKVGSDATPLNAGLVPGSTYEIRIRATQAHGKTKESFVRMSIDGTPPELWDFRFVCTPDDRGTQGKHSNMCAVAHAAHSHEAGAGTHPSSTYYPDEHSVIYHNIRDLKKAVVKFSALDRESSVLQIKWRILRHTNKFHRNADGTIKPCGKYDVDGCGMNFDENENNWHDSTAKAGSAYASMKQAGGGVYTTNQKKAGIVFKPGDPTQHTTEWEELAAGPGNEGRLQLKASAVNNYADGHLADNCEYKNALGTLRVTNVPCVCTRSGSIMLDEQMHHPDVVLGPGPEPCTDANCDECNADPATCTTCAPGYFKRTNHKCSPCAANCKTCTGAAVAQCATNGCEKGYFQNGDKSCHLIGRVCIPRDFDLRLLRTDKVLLHAQHNRQYTFELSVVNRAGLATIQRRTIQIDLTAPKSGTAVDATPGGLDIDYQDDRMLRASWNGFSDPESGIRGYMYKWTLSTQSAEDVAADKILDPATQKKVDANGIDDGCLAMYKNKDGVIKDFNPATDETNLQGWTVTPLQSAARELPNNPKKGERWVLTVFAFNNAMEPSRAVCSDGVTVDTRKPVASAKRVHFDGLRGPYGLVYGSAGPADNGELEAPALWLLYANLTRARVTSAQGCTRADAYDLGADEGCSDAAKSKSACPAGRWTEGVCDNKSRTQKSCVDAGGIWTGSASAGACSNGTPSKTACNTVGTWANGACSDTVSQTEAACTTVNKWIEGTCSDASTTRAACKANGGTWKEPTWYDLSGHQWNKQSEFVQDDASPGMWSHKWMKKIGDTLVPVTKEAPQLSWDRDACPFPKPPTLAFIMHSQAISMTWELNNPEADAPGIYGWEVGLGKAPAIRNSVANPVADPGLGADDTSFKYKQVRTPQFVIANKALIDSKEFYIQLRTLTHSGQAAVQSFGPIFIYQTSTPLLTSRDGLTGGEASVADGAVAVTVYKLEGESVARLEATWDPTKHGDESETEQECKDAGGSWSGEGCDNGGLSKIFGNMHHYSSSYFIGIGSGEARDERDDIWPFTEVDPDEIGTTGGCTDVAALPLPRKKLCWSILLDTGGGKLANLPSHRVYVMACSTVFWGQCEWLRSTVLAHQPHAPPARGTVVDIEAKSADSNGVHDDIYLPCLGVAVSSAESTAESCHFRLDADYQSSTIKLEASWGGFDTDEIEGLDRNFVTYEFGVSTAQFDPEKDDESTFAPDVTPWENVPIHQKAHSVDYTSTPLSKGQVYYPVVRATNVMGQAVVSSDGIKVTPFVEEGMAMSVRIGDKATLSDRVALPALVNLPATLTLFRDKAFAAKEAKPVGWAKTGTCGVNLACVDLVESQCDPSNNHVCTWDSGTDTCSGTQRDKVSCLAATAITVAGQPEQLCRWISDAQWQHEPGASKTGGQCTDPIPASITSAYSPVTVPNLLIGSTYTITIVADTNVASTATGSNPKVRFRIGCTAHDIDLHALASLPADSEKEYSFVFQAKTASEGLYFEQTIFTDELSEELKGASITVHTVTVKRGEVAADFVAAGTALQLYWDFTKPTGTASDYVWHFEWRLKRQSAAEGAFKEETKFKNAGTELGVSTGIGLEADAVYQAEVRACMPAGCYDHKTSAAVTVGSASAPEPPTTALTALYFQTTPHDLGTTSVSLGWDAFTHGSVPIVAYEWTLSTSETGSGLLIGWQTLPVKPEDVAKPVILHRQLFNIDMSQFEVDGRRMFLIIRAHAKDGKYGTAHTAAKATSVLPPSLRVMVKDVAIAATNPIAALEPTDIEYTDASSDLQAAWPGLWGTYSPDFVDWSVSTTQEYDEDCTTSESTQSAYPAVAIKCGTTKGAFTTAIASGLALQHGWRYYFCLKAGPTTTHFPDGTTEVATNKDVKPVCSNGVTVDWESPAGGAVSIGSEHNLGIQGAVFQHTGKVVRVSWHGFFDVEAHGASPHESSIVNYRLELGSATGHADIWAEDVGVALSHRVDGLDILDGTTIYANVTAFDHVGHTTSVYSTPVTVDSSPPTAGVIQVVSAAMDRHNTNAELIVEWTGFSDADSGIARYEVGIGSEPGYGDFVDFADVGLRNFLEQSVHIPGGHHYYVSIRCTNLAGLVQEASSILMIAPKVLVSTGHVVDGEDLDVDFQSDRTQTSAHWSGFGDAVEYMWAIGSSPKATDVRGWESNGMHTSASQGSLSFRDGQHYYTSVKALDINGNEVVTSSDGFFVDGTPPIAGEITDGFGSSDARFQVGRDALGASWSGFADPESGLSHYEWCAGTVAGGDNLEHLCSLTNSKFVDVGLSTSATMLQSVIFPQAPATVFFTVRAFNRVGLSVSTISNGIMLDETAPTLTGGVEPYWVPITPESVKFPGTTASSHPLVGNFQHVTTSLQAKWSFSDPASANDNIEHAMRMVVSVSTRKSGSPDKESMHSFTRELKARLDAQGALQTGMFLQDLPLEDGERYYLAVSACDEAGLCTESARQSEAQALLVDGSPPVSGGLLHIGTWSQYSLTLKWQGFSDPHSGIHDYLVAVGSDYGLDDVVGTTSVKPACTFEGHPVAGGKNKVTGGTAACVVTDCAANKCKASKTTRYANVNKLKADASWLRTGGVANSLYRRMKGSGTVKFTFQGATAGVHLNKRPLVDPTKAVAFDHNDLLEIAGGAYANVRTMTTTCDHAAVNTACSNHYQHSTTHNDQAAKNQADIHDGGHGLGDPTDSGAGFGLADEPFAKFLAQTSDPVNTATFKLPASGSLAIVKERAYYITITARNTVGLLGEPVHATVIAREKKTPSNSKSGALELEQHSCKHVRCKISHVSTCKEKPKCTDTMKLDPNHRKVCRIANCNDSDEAACAAAPGGDKAACEGVETSNTDDVADTATGVGYACIYSGAGDINTNEDHYRCTCGPHGECASHEADPKGSATQACQLLPKANMDCTVRDGLEDKVDAVYQLDTRTYSAHWECTGSDAVARAEISVSQVPTNDGTCAAHVPGDPNSMLHGKVAASDFDHEMHVWRGSTQLWGPKGHAGSGTFSTHALSSGIKGLLYDFQYVFHLRIWTGNTHYQDFKSDGVWITRHPPYVQLGRAQVVESGTKQHIIGDDSDHFKSDGQLSNILSVSWASAAAAVFHQGAQGENIGQTSTASITNYEVMIGTSPRTANVVAPIVVPSTVGQKSFLLRNLWPGAFYHSTVVAINSVGFRSAAGSDGFIVDESPPAKGVVRDGMGPVDINYQHSKRIEARWQGFKDPESRIVSYTWSIGTFNEDGRFEKSTFVRDKNVFVPFGKHEINGADIAEIKAGVPYVAMVQAMNSAGMLSEPSYSDGVIIDSTVPKMGMCRPDKFKNVLSADPVWMRDGDPAPQLFEGGIDQRHVGFSTYKLPPLSSIQCKLNGLEAGTRYQLRFQGSVVSPNPGVVQLGRVVIPGILRETFKVKNSAVAGVEEWSEYTYHFTAASGDVQRLKFVGLDVFAGNGLVLVASVEVRPCEGAAGTLSDGEAIDVEVTGSGVNAAWHPFDEESNIADIRWAVGTAAGGEQLQVFTAVGAETTTGVAIVRGGIPHGTDVHVTVAVTNRAGQSAVFYSKPVTADVTPPAGTITMARGFEDGIIEADINTIVDLETGVVSCSWGVGSQPGLVDLFGWTLAVKAEADVGGFRSVSTKKKLEDSVHGLVVYVSARCENGAHLSSIISSNAAVIVEKSSADAVVEILSPPSQVSNRALAALPGFQTSTSEVHWRWHGFFLGSNMVDHYESRMGGPSYPADGVWKNEGLRSASSLVELELAPGSTYTVSVRAVDAAKKETVEHTATVTIVEDPPEVAIAGGIGDAGAVAEADDLMSTAACATLDIVGLTLAWKGVFVDAAESPVLRYVVSIGFDAKKVLGVPSPGAGDVLRGRDVVTPADRADLAAKTTIQKKDLPVHMQMNGNEIPADVAKLVGKMIATVTAVNQAGLATTKSFFLPQSKC